MEVCSFLVVGILFALAVSCKFIFTRRTEGRILTTEDTENTEYNFF